MPRLPAHLPPRLRRSNLPPIAAHRRNLLPPQLAVQSMRPRWPLPQAPRQRPLGRLPLSNNNSSSAPRNARGGLRRLPIAVSKRSKITHKTALRWPKNIIPASKPNSDPEELSDTELGLRGIPARSQVSYWVTYKGKLIGEYVADLLAPRGP
jgi:hypothetical protein